MKHYSDEEIKARLKWLEIDEPTLDDSVAIVRQLLAERDEARADAIRERDRGIAREGGLSNTVANLRAEIERKELHRSIEAAERDKLARANNDFRTRALDLVRKKAVTWEMAVLHALPNDQTASRIAKAATALRELEKEIESL